jgi:hypothetical protein
MTPAMLGATGWLGLVRGVVVAPQAATCGSRCIDYFVVSESFAHVVAGVAVVEDAGFKPHSPVRLYLRPRPRSIFVRRVLMPSTLGAVYPAGPVNQRRTPPSARATPAPSNGSGREGWPAWDAEYSAWITDAEEELVDLLGLTGRERSRHCGRAIGPRVRWEPAIGPTARAQLFVNAATTTWRSTTAALYDIALCHRAVARSRHAHDAAGSTRATAAAAVRRLCTLRLRAIAADPKLGTSLPRIAVYHDRTINSGDDGGGGG